MFNSIFGTITAKFNKHVYLLNQGIEWDIIVPETAIDKLPFVGNECKIYTFLNHTENSMDLYGFSSEEERRLFFDLLKVDGIGAKGAIKIMSSVSSLDLINALEKEDLSALEKIQGIGKKTASKMILALRGKLSVVEKIVSTSKNSIYSVVIKSLVEMGYDKNICEETINNLLKKYNTDESFILKNQIEKEDFLFKSCIMELSR